MPVEMQADANDVFELVQVHECGDRKTAIYSRHLVQKALLHRHNSYRIQSAGIFRVLYNLRQRPVEV
jgi:hypothetical protein